MNLCTKGNSLCDQWFIPTVPGTRALLLCFLQLLTSTTKGEHNAEINADSGSFLVRQHTEYYIIIR